MAFSFPAANLPCLHQQSTMPAAWAPSTAVPGTPMVLPRQISRRSRSRLVAQAVAATKIATEKKVPAKPVEMSPETAADLYRDMMLGRDFEDMCAQMYYRGKMFGELRLRLSSASDPPPFFQSLIWPVDSHPLRVPTVWPAHGRLRAATCSAGQFRACQASFSIALTARCPALTVLTGLVSMTSRICFRAVVCCLNVARVATVAFFASRQSLASLSLCTPCWNSSSTL